MNIRIPLPQAPWGITIAASLGPPACLQGLPHPLRGPGALILLLSEGQCPLQGAGASAWAPSSAAVPLISSATMRTGPTSSSTTGVTALSWMLRPALVSAASALCPPPPPTGDSGLPCSLQAPQAPGRENESASAQLMLHVTSNHTSILNIQLNLVTNN